MKTNTLDQITLDAPTRRDSRDWRNVAPAHKVRRRTQRRRATKQAVLSAYYREGGYR